MVTIGAAPLGRMTIAAGVVALLAGCAAVELDGAQQSHGKQQYAGQVSPATQLVQSEPLYDPALEDDPDEGWFGPDNDPLETVNRFTFAFNDAVDTMIIRPAAVTYRFLVPDPVQDSVQNALRNLNGPVVLANDLLQGEWERAETTAMRFLINSTVGVAGLFDVASDWGYEYHREDFGQTLGTWGVGEGFYLVLPILGPSTLRDAVGMGVDSLIDPWSYVLRYGAGMSDDTVFWVMVGRRALEGIDLRARNIETLDSVRRDSVDFYARMRTLYRQNRQSEIRNGELDEIPIPGLSEGDWLKETSPTPGPSSAALDERKNN